jgi:hypothetical protein
MEHRYAPPSKFEESKQGTMCKVIGDNNKHETYIQLSPDEKCPEWQKIGFLFESVFEDNQEFHELIDKYVKLYTDKKNLTLPL